MNFQAFVNDIRGNGWNVHGAEIYRDGELIHEYGDTRETRYPIYSAAKTVLSLGVGMAWDEGKIDLYRNVLDYLPEKAVSAMTEIERGRFAGVTIERLLTMSVDGFPFRPEGESYLRFALSCPIREERTFSYSNISAYLVGVALTEALGEDAYTYLNRRLFAPLGIENPPFSRCPEGYFYGASNMALTVNELSRVGLLLLGGGVYEGKRLVSAEYIEKATPSGR